MGLETPASYTGGFRDAFLIGCLLFSGMVAVWAVMRAAAADANPRLRPLGPVLRPKLPWQPKTARASFTALLRAARAFELADAEAVEANRRRAEALAALRRAHDEYDAATEALHKRARLLPPALPALRDAAE